MRTKREGEEEKEFPFRIRVTAENEEALIALAEVIKQGAVLRLEEDINVDGVRNVTFVVTTKAEAEAAEAARKAARMRRVGVAAGLVLLLTGIGAYFGGILVPAAF